MACKVNKKGLSHLRACSLLSCNSCSECDREGKLGVNDDSNALVFSLVPEPGYLWSSNEPVHLETNNKTSPSFSPETICAKLGPPKRI